MKLACLILLCLWPLIQFGFTIHKLGKSKPHEMKDSEPFIIIMSAVALVLIKYNILAYSGVWEMLILTIKASTQ